MLRMVGAAMTLLLLMLCVSNAAAQGANPTDAVGFLIRGESRGDRNDDRAIADYSEAIRLNPEFATAYASRARAFMARGELNRAIADYTETIKLAPKVVGPYEYRAQCWYAKREYDRAIADLTEAIRLGRTHLVGFRGYLWHLKGNFDQAIADYDEKIKAARGSANRPVEEFLRADAKQQKAPSRDYIDPPETGDRSVVQQGTEPDLTALASTPRSVRPGLSDWKNACVLDSGDGRRLAPNREIWYWN